jgi:hypothetical protein
LPKPSEEVWLAQRKAMKKIPKLVFNPTYIHKGPIAWRGLSGLNGRLFNGFLVSEFFLFAAQGKQERWNTG